MTALVLTGGLLLPGMAFGQGGGDQQDDEWADDWGEEEEIAGRSFLYLELVLSGLHAPSGIKGIPMGDMSPDHFELNPRPPGNYLGIDFVQTFTAASFVNTDILPDWLPLTAIDLHPRLVFDRMETRSGFDQFDFAPQDFWLKFNPGGADRLSLRLGQFVIPYGVNPPLAPRQKFLLPVEATDLGLKWDWGLDLKGPAGEYDWEVAGTVGSGEALHSLDFYRGAADTSYLLTGRIGAPTYWDLQYGVSFLYGDLPVIRASNILSPVSISRWRLGLDGMYKYGTYLLTGAQVTFGQDGFQADKRFLSLTGGTTANVLGLRAWVDWVVPVLQDLRLGLQAESVVRDLSTPGSDDTAVILEAAYSLSTSTSLMLDIRLEENNSMGTRSNAIYLAFVYYGL